MRNKWGIQLFYLIFLFNNLSILSALVYYGDRKAVEYINEFSQVYRYVLAIDKIELVSLEEELSLLNYKIKHKL